jgi:hypothetical protein
VSRLPQLRATFLEAAERRALASAPLSPRRRPLRLIAIAALCLLLLTAAALAAGGVLPIGSSVPSAGRQTPTVGLGVPARGGSRVLAVSFPDPAGGPPWGIRVVHTTRDLVCLQVGRLYRGQLGVLGRDGAFADDGQFHPLPAQAIEGLGAHCDVGGPYSSNEISGIPASGEVPPSGKLGSLSQARWISYGLLGPHAVSVTYRYRGRSHSIAVEPRTGAYLIVLPGIEPGTRGIQAGGSGGGGSAATVLPSGALTVLTYRFATDTCQEGDGQTHVSNPCPAGPRGFRRLSLAPSLDLHRPIHVRLRRASAPGGYSAIVRFTAPYAVRNARSGYSIAIPAQCHEGTVVDPIDRDVRLGATVTVSMRAMFANACGSAVTLEVLYSQGGSGRFTGSRTILVGRITVRRPRARSAGR